MTNSTIFIVIPVYNRRDDTLKCLECLRRQTFKAWKVIVVDDGSNDGLAPAVRSNFPEAVLLEGDGNLWWSGATNLGVEWAQRQAGPQDYVLTLNNDLTVRPDYLDQLMSASNQLGRKALIGSVSVSSSNHSQILYQGNRRNWWLGTTRPAVQKVQGGLVFFETDGLPGRGTLIPIEAFASVGNFDAKNFPQYFADVDFSLRCRQKGYRLIVARDAVVISDAEKTGLGSKFTYDRMTWRDAVRSLWSIRSAKHLGKRWRFALRHCPPLKLPVHLFADTVIVTTSFFRKKYIR